MEKTLSSTCQVSIRSLGALTPMLVLLATSMGADVSFLVSPDLGVLMTLCLQHIPNAFPILFALS